jgi:inner membrane protein
MDSITHTVIGACLGEAIAGKQLGKKAMLFGILANNLPDVDIISGFWTSQAAGLLAHRGITHSILFAVVISPLLAWFFMRAVKNNTLPFTKWLLLIGSGLFLHILLDACTTYGTGWFEPFSHARVSFNTLFILDPFFSLPCIVAAIALWILKRASVQKRKWFTRLGLALSGLYLLVTICIKLYVNKVIETDLASKKIPYTTYMAAPTPLNNLLWCSIVKDSNVFYTGYYSLLDATTRVDWERFRKNDSLLQPYKNVEDVQNLVRFSKGYYRVVNQDSILVFSDTRFGLIGGWLLKDAPFVFNFNIKPNKKGEVKVEQAEFKAFEKSDITLLFDRVKGR